MRIAQVAPLFESVPPRYYGGTERVVSYLTEELVRQGHHVTLFASGDSVTSASLVSSRARARRLDETTDDGMAYEVLMLEQVFQRLRDFDIVHFHIDYLHFPIVRRQPCTHVTTAHGRLDIRAVDALFREYDDLPLVSISASQREPVSWANWVATVHHGLPADLYAFEPKAGEYLAFLGRLSPEKRPDHAVRVAEATGMPLRVAAKVDDADREYFDAVVRPLLDHPLVEFVGEIGDGQKQEFLGRAAALLFTIDWPEPFGLVSIESMACGTPVIAYRRGAVPEVVEEGRGGFVVDGLAGAVEAVGRLPGLSRRACREAFEERFTAERMAKDYLAVYERLVSVRRPSREVVAAT